MFLMLTKESAAMVDYQEVQAHELSDGTFLYVAPVPGAKLPKLGLGNYLACPRCRKKISYTAAEGRIQLGEIIE